MELIFLDRISIILRFDYKTNDNAESGIPKDIRKSLIGIESKKYKKIVIVNEINEKLKEIFGKKLLIPLFFALIKEPIELKAIDGKMEMKRIINKARGALCIYSYTGSDSQIETTCNLIKEIINGYISKKYPFKTVYEYEIIMGKRY